MCNGCQSTFSHVNTPLVSSNSRCLYKVLLECLPTGFLRSKWVKCHLQGRWLHQNFQVATIPWQAIIEPQEMEWVTGWEVWATGNQVNWSHLQSSNTHVQETLYLIPVDLNSGPIHSLSRKIVATTHSKGDSNPPSKLLQPNQCLTLTYQQSELVESKIY